MFTTAIRPRKSASPTVWTIRAGKETYRVRTSSARTALRHAIRSGGRRPVIIGLELNPTEAVPMPRVPQTRFDRLRRSLLPEAVRRRNAGESVTEIAAALKVPRETLRDWLLAAGL